MVANASFRTVFGNFNASLGDLALTQEQIITFVEENEDWLHPDWATFFPFKAGDKFFVAGVGRNAGRPGVGVSRRFGGTVVGRNRFVFPQQTMKS